MNAVGQLVVTSPNAGWQLVVTSPNAGGQLVVASPNAGWQLVVASLNADQKPLVTSLNAVVLVAVVGGVVVVTLVAECYLWTAFLLSLRSVSQNELPVAKHDSRACYESLNTTTISEHCFTASYESRSTPHHGLG